MYGIRITLQDVQRVCEDGDVAWLTLIGKAFVVDRDGVKMKRKSATKSDGSRNMEAEPLEDCAVISSTRGQFETV